MLRVKCFDKEVGTYVFSENYKLDYGMPQGSCLGPLLFLIYTNDIHKNLMFTSCLLFADDTTVYCTHENANYLKFCIEHGLSIISDWFKANGLTLNLDKSICIIFPSIPNQQLTKINISADKTCIPFVSHTKFLGVWIDKNLNWNHHISTLTQKLK